MFVISPRFEQILSDGEKQIGIKSLFANNLFPNVSITLVGLMREIASQPQMVESQKWSLEIDHRFQSQKWSPGNHHTFQSRIPMTEMESRKSSQIPMTEMESRKSSQIPITETESRKLSQ